MSEYKVEGARSRGLWQRGPALFRTVSAPASRMQGVVVLLIGACLLCLPAFYNGYPLVFSDLLDYATDGMKIVRKQWPGGSHPPFYGVAIWPLHLERSLWPVVIAQGLIVSHLLATVLRVAGAAVSGPAFLLLLAGMAVLTSLPWYVSHVMPDVFGGVLILSLFLIAFSGDKISFWEKMYFSCLAIGSLVIHISFLPVGIVILILSAGFRLLRWRGRNLPRPVFALVPLLVALGLSSYVSMRFWGEMSGPPYAPPYLLAHTLVDGKGKAYLRAVCGRQHYVLCDYQDSIPDNVEDFMFRGYSPYSASGRPKQIRAEAGAIVLGTAKMFPLRTLETALKAGLLQTVTFGTEVAQLEDLPDGRGGSLADVFEKELPFIWTGYEGTKQQQDLLSPERLRPMNDVHRVVVALSALFSVFALVRSIRHRDWALIQFLTVVWAGLLVNAFVTGVAVGVFGRFGARVIWLLPFAAVTAGLSMRQVSRRAVMTDISPGVLP